MYEEKQEKLKKSGRGTQKIEGPWKNPLIANKNIQSQGWGNPNSPVAEVKFTGPQLINKRPNMSMEMAFQNEMIIKVADMEQRLNMNQAESMKSMREEVKRLQTQLFAEMDSKLEVGSDS